MAHYHAPIVCAQPLEGKVKVHMPTEETREESSLASPWGALCRVATMPSPAVAKTLAIIKVSELTTAAGGNGWVLHHQCSVAAGFAASVAMPQRLPHAYSRDPIHPWYLNHHKKLMNRDMSESSGL